MSCLENNICNLLGNRLMLTTPLEVGGTLLALAAQQSQDLPWLNDALDLANLLICSSLQGKFFYKPSSPQR